MFKLIGKVFGPVAISILLASSIVDSAHARSYQEAETPTHQIDVVIALDVSGSMTGLIESAKQRVCGELVLKLQQAGDTGLGSNCASGRNADLRPSDVYRRREFTTSDSESS